MFVKDTRCPKSTLTPEISFPGNGAIALFEVASVVSHKYRTKVGVA